LGTPDPFLIRTWTLAKADFALKPPLFESQKTEKGNDFCFFIDDVIFKEFLPIAFYVPFAFALGGV